MLFGLFTVDLLRMQEITGELINSDSKVFSSNDILNNDLLKIKELTGGLTRANSNEMFCTALILPGQPLNNEKGTIRIATGKHCIYDDDGKLNEINFNFSLAKNQNKKFKSVEI